MPDQTLAMTADELKDMRNQNNAKEAIDQGRPVRIVVTGPLAAVLSVAVAKEAAKSDPSSPAEKKALAAEAERKAKERALAAAKRKALKKSRLAAAKQKAKEKAIADARKEVFAVASKQLGALDPTGRTVQTLADAEAKIAAAADDKALADALNASLTDAEKTIDTPGTSTGRMTAMVAGVDDAVIITIAIVVGVIAVLGFAALTTIALYAISKDYIATGENSGGTDLINYKFIFDLKPGED